MPAGVALAIRDYVHNKVPWVIPQAPVREFTAPTPKASPYILRINDTFDQGNVTMGRWVPKHTSDRRFVVLGSNFEAGRQCAAAFKAGLQEAGGQVVKEIYPPLATPDFAPFLSQIDPAQADAVYAWVAGADAVRFVKQFAEYGLKGRIPLVGYATLTDDPLLPAMGDAALGIVTNSLYTPQLAVPANVKFLRDYEAAYGAVPSRYSETAYTGAQLIVKGIQLLKADVKNREAVVRTIREGAGQIESPRGRVTFDKYGQVIPTIYISRAEKKGGRTVNTIIDQVPDVTQESTWGWWLKDLPR